MRNNGAHCLSVDVSEAEQRMQSLKSYLCSPVVSINTFMLYISAHTYTHPCEHLMDVCPRVIEDMLLTPSFKYN